MSFTEKYLKFEEDVVTAFREKYSLWSDVEEKDMDICSNGDVFVGGTQFITGIHSNNYIN